MLLATRNDSSGVETFTCTCHGGLRYFNNPGGTRRVLRVADGAVGGAADLHRRHPSATTSNSRQTKRKTTEDVLEIHGMETLVQACERRGIDRTAALMIIGQYSVDGQLPKHSVAAVLREERHQPLRLRRRQRQGRTHDGDTARKRHGRGASTRRV